jgi:hypothetical protein
MHALTPSVVNIPPEFSVVIAVCGWLKRVVRHMFVVIEMASQYVVVW